MRHEAGDARRVACSVQCVWAVEVCWGVFGVVGYVRILVGDNFSYFMQHRMRHTLHAARAEHTWLHGAAWQMRSVNKCAKCHFYGGEHGVCVMQVLLMIYWLYKKARELGKEISS